jgi:predicted metalloprotease
MFACLLCCCLAVALARRFASIQMALCALPAMLLMQLGTQHATASSSSSAGGSAAGGAAALGQLQWVWGGLILVMACRAGSIALPYALGLTPFKVLTGPQQQQQQQQQPRKASPQEQ